MNNDCQALWNTLDDVVAVIKRSYSPETGSGLLMSSEIFTSFFKRPRHEITMDMMVRSIALLPLFLSHQRLPSDVIDLTVAEAKRLVAAARLIERKRKVHKQSQGRMLLQLDDRDLSRLYCETRKKKPEPTRLNLGPTLQASTLTPENLPLRVEFIHPPVCEQQLPGSLKPVETPLIHDDRG